MIHRAKVLYPDVKPERHSGHGGFTLIEMLIVIVIIAVLSGIAVFSISSTESRRLNAEAVKLMITLNHLMDQALMQQQNMKWVYGPDSKQCEVYRMLDSGEWQLTANQKRYSCFSRHIHNFTLEYPIAEANEQVIENSDKDENQDKQALVFFTSAEYTPFEITIEGRENTSYSLKGDGLNPVIMESLTP